MADEFVEEERVSMEEDVAHGSGGEVVEEEVDQEGEEVLEEGMEFAEEHAETQDVDATAAAMAGSGTTDINIERFDELILPAELVTEAQKAWGLLIAAAGSKEAVGEAFYQAIYDSAPSLRALFTTPRTVQALRMFTQMNSMVSFLVNPADLRTHVEALGFWHMAFDVTVPRCIVFRDCLLDLFVAELGSKLTSGAASALTSLLNYVAGAIVYCKLNFATRMRILNESWAIANDKGANSDKFGSMELKEKEKAAKAHEDVSKAEDGKESGKKTDSNAMVQNVPTTYKEMFQFNAAVMGFGNSLWMNEILAQFENVVENASNAARLQEEASVLVLRIAKITSSKVNLLEYKSCMLASLRSLLPKDWTTEHEVAWVWLFECLEKLMMSNMGKTQGWLKELENFYDTMDEASWYQLRAEFYAKFFVESPAGESYFKQSNTYLHLIAAKIANVVVTLFNEPIQVVDMISGMGLRHVGYQIPVELFQPLVTVWIDCFRSLGASETATDGFSWSLSLIAKMQTRTITEGTTVVMKAINANSAKQFQRSVSFAPRGERATWCLLITAGTQTISPFLWSIQSGALDASTAILSDLITIRADRDRYYYAAQDLFMRHRDIVKILLDEAPALLPQLLDGLIWRSRNTVAGYRRVNYYIKDLLIGEDGSFHKVLDWIGRSQDAKIVCHSVLVLLADLVWSRVACRSFMFKKSWFLFTLFMFLISQSILNGLEATDGTRIVTFAFRAFIYLFSMGVMIFNHIGAIVRSYRKKDTVLLAGRIPVPKYLENWQDSANLVLTIFLVVMLATEPILHCLHDDGGMLFNGVCAASKNISMFPYSFFTMLAMILYYVLLIDLAVFNNRISAYVLVVGRMLPELALFLLALAIVMLTLSSSLSCLEQDLPEFKNIGTGVVAMWEMILAMFSQEDYVRMHDYPVVLFIVYLYLIAGMVFLLNLLVAQLTCAYDAIYKDMVGYARLKRLKIIVECMPSVTPKRWASFVAYLDMDKRLEFNEGDVGLSGGVQVLDLASANPTTVDIIKRFGGSTSPSVKWPEEENTGDDDNDRFQRLEDLIKKVGDQVAKATTVTKKKVAGGASSSGMSGGPGASGEEDAEHDEEADVVVEEVEGEE